MAMKAIAGNHFSLVSFGVAQILIDLEPLVRIIRGDAILHGFTHTYVGAALLGAVAAALSFAICPRLARFWNAESGQYAWLAIPARPSVHAIVLGAFLGTGSHVLLDSVMHADMQPIWPAASANRLLHLIDIETLHLLCLAAGIAGLIFWFGAAWLTQRRSGT